MPGKPFRFEGVITALVTPMRDGRVDLPALTALVEEQIAAGVDGLVPVGTTGESPTLSHEEKLQVIGHVVQTVKMRVPVIAGTGSNDTAASIELSRAAQKLGVDGLLLVAPYYNRPTQEGMFRHFQAITEAVPVPAILYNVPGRTASDLQPDTVARLAELPGVVGIKEATGNMCRASELISRLGDRMAILSGDDFTMFPLYALGGRGVISVVSNVAPKATAELWDAAVAGNWVRARELHYKLMPLVELLFQEPSPAPVKAALSLAGKMSDELRPPLYTVAPALRDKLRAAMLGAGLL